MIAQRAAPTGLPGNVRLRVFGSTARPWRALRFLDAVNEELRRRPRPSAIVCHMIPLYAILAAPLARPRGVRVVLWYTHWNATWKLRLAERLSDAVVSVDRRSFPLASDKVRAIGHGIDLRDFPCRGEGAAPDGTLWLLALGRYSPAKGLDVVLRAVRRARADGLDVRLTTHGPPAGEHQDELRRLAVELGLEESVELGQAVPRSELPGLFAEADLLVNNMRAGAPDKVVYEACAGCLPVVASNPVFDELFAGLEPELGFARENPDELAARLQTFAALDPSARAALGRELRGRVAASHSVDSWADGILQACT